MENITNETVEYIVKTIKKDVEEASSQVKTDVDASLAPTKEKVDALDETIKSINKRFGAIEKHGSEEKYVKYKRAVAFLEVIRDRSKGLDITSNAKSLGFDVADGNGAVLLPCEMWDDIMKSERCSASLLNYVRRMRGSFGGGISMRSLLGKPTVGFVGTCGKNTCTKVSFGKTPKLNYEKIFAILPVCNDLLADQRDPGMIERTITDAMAEAVGLFWDDVIMNGDGITVPFYGIVNATNANGFNTTNGYIGGVNEYIVNAPIAPSTTIQDITRDDLINLIASSCCDGGRFFMSCQTFGLIMKMKDSENRPLFDSLSLSNRNIMGYEVVITDTLPRPDYTTPANDSGKTFIVFGDLSKAMTVIEADSVEIGTKQDVAYECDKNLQSAFSNDESVFYVRHRAMSVVTNPEKIAVLKTA